MSLSVYISLHFLGTSFGFCFEKETDIQILSTLINILFLYGFKFFKVDNIRGIKLSLLKEW